MNFQAPLLCGLGPKFQGPMILTPLVDREMRSDYVKFILITEVKETLKMISNGKGDETRLCKIHF